MKSHLGINLLLNLAIVRAAEPKEAKLISQLAIRSKAYWGYDATFMQNCQAELTYQASHITSAKYDFQVAQIEAEQIVGFYALHYTDSAHLELEALFVEPTNIGQGFGKQLLLSAITHAKQQNAKSIRIQADPFAEAFYLANGAIKTGQLESQSIPGRFLPALEIRL